MDDQRLDRIEAKMDKLADNQSAMNATLATLTVSVQTHEKRSTNLEEIVLPLKKENDEIHGAVRFIKLCALIVGMLVGLAELAHWLK